MKDIVGILNKNTPQKLDRVTTFISAVCNNGSLIFINELSNADEVRFNKFDKTQMPIFKKIRSSALKSIYCDLLSEIHDFTNSIIWTYNLADSKLQSLSLQNQIAKGKM